MTTTTRRVSIKIDGRSVPAEVDAEGRGFWIEHSGRRVLVPAKSGDVTFNATTGVVTSFVPRDQQPARRAAAPVVTSVPTAPSEEDTMTAKRRAVREAASRPPLPRDDPRRPSVRELARKLSARQAHEAAFKAGYDQARVEYLRSPLDQRISEDDAERLVELVMERVLADRELRAGFTFAASLTEQLEAGDDPADADQPAEPESPIVPAVPVAAEPIVEVPAPAVVAHVPAQPVEVTAERPEPVAPRAFWSGAISCGLMNVPVKLFGATQDHGIELHQVHQDDGGRIKYVRQCSCCDRTPAFGELGKGHESGAWLTVDEVKSAQASGPKDFIVDRFVDADEIDPSLWSESYQVGAGKDAERAYSLFRETLRSTGRVAVGTIRLRTATSLAVVRVVEDRLVLNTLRWADEVRTPMAAPADVELTDLELANAAGLVEAMAGKFDHATYTDPTQIAMAEMLAAKTLQGTPAGPSSAGQVTDLIASIDAAVAA